jgi:uncharacterized linocin/CFP29 family protein
MNAITPGSVLRPSAAQVDFYSREGGGATPHGSVATRLLQSGMSVQALRTLDVLTKEEWLLYDTTVIQVARQRLVAVADLLDRGLRFDLANGLGTTVVQWDTISDMDPAEVSMSGVTEGIRDRQLFSLKSLPIPLIHKDFSINIRVLEASRRRGESLDTTQAAMATRLVVEGVENMLFNGNTLQEGVYGTIPGYKTTTNRVTGSLTDWTVGSSASPSGGQNAVHDILAMIGALNAKHMYGPYMIYVPVAWGVALGDDFKVNGDRTTIERILAIPGVLGVRSTEYLVSSPKAEVLMVQMTSDVVDEVVGMQPTTVMWEEIGGMVVRFKVMAIMIPRVKADYKAQCGIAHFTQP